MPSINMIAVRGAERKRLERLTGITLLVIACELAITLFLLGFMTTRVMSANREVRRLDGKLERIRPTVDKIHSYEGEIKKLEPRLDLLADSREQTLVWYTVMQNLGRSMPANTWLCALTTSRPVVVGGSNEKAPPAPTVSLRGVSTSQALIGETMLRMNQFPEFERVDLNYTQTSPGRAVDCVEFQVAALMKPTAPGKGRGSTDAKD